MTHTLKHHIPQQWTGDMALCFVRFLDQLIAAVWDQHGRAMFDLLDQYSLYNPEKPPGLYDPVDDEIPF